MCVNANGTDWNEAFSREACSFRLAYLESCFHFFRCIFFQTQRAIKASELYLKNMAILDIVFKKQKKTDMAFSRGHSSGFESEL